MTPDAKSVRHSEQELLEARARVLARAPEQDAEGTRLQLLAFSLGVDTYAVETRHVLGVFRLLDLAPLPGAGRHIAGVTVWRGDLLTVVDLRRVLGLEGDGLDDRAWIVVIGDVRRRRGLLAGALRDVLDLRETALRDPTDRVVADRRFVRGLTNEAVVVLHAEALLTNET